MVSSTLVRLVVLLLICAIYTVCSATVYSASNRQHTTGRHLVVMKPGVTADVARGHSRHSNWTKKLLIRIGETLAARYNISVLRHFFIGNWRALLVNIGNNSAHGMSGEQDIDYIEQEVKVTAFPMTGNMKYTKIVEKTEDVISESYVDIFITKDSSASSNETSEPVSCFQQKPGNNIWALQRISSHPKPISYKSADYLFTSIDEGDGVDIYVADTGIRTSHQEFSGRADSGYVAAGIDEGPEDNNGHGTHVSSLVAGNTVGAAKKAHVINVKVLNEAGMGDVSWIIDGLQWITDRVAAQRSSGKVIKPVINLSLGVVGVAYSLEAAIQAVIDDMDIIVVAAAGNDGGDACNVSPARMASVITIGATASDDTLTSFSNYGPCVDMLAPGDFVLGAYSISDDSYAYISGTSQASPLVSGVVARYISSIDGAMPTPALVKAYITDTASEGYIDYATSLAQTTPNKLVYRACESMSNDHPEYRATYPDTSGNSAAVMYIVPLLNFALLFLSFMAVKCNVFACNTVKP